MHTSIQAVQSHGRTVVTLDLKIPDVLSKSIVSNINDACARSEDAGTGAVLVIRISHAGTNGDADSVITGVSMVNAWNRALRALERLNTMTIAVADESVGSLGLAVVLATDYRVARPGVCFGMSYRGQEIMPDMMLYRLANQAGPAAARRLSLSTAELPASDAQGLGLIDVISEYPQDIVEKLLGARAATSGDAYAIRRRLIKEAASTTYEEALGHHLAACDRVLRSSAAATERHG